MSSRAARKFLEQKKTKPATPPSKAKVTEEDDDSSEDSEVHDEEVRGQVVKGGNVFALVLTLAPLPLPLSSSDEIIPS